MIDTDFGIDTENMWRLAASTKMRFRTLTALAAGLVLLASSGLVLSAQSDGDRYAEILANADSLVRYNALLEKQLQSQEEQIALIEKQLVDIDATAASVGPLVQRMFEAIEAFIAIDLPFIDPTQAGPDSRSARIKKVRELMADETALMSEKYRRLLEVYQIELEYGRTMVSYKGKLDDGREADFLRVGRVSLMYRTVDGEEAGYWDAEQKAWVVNNDFGKAIETAVQVATKETAPELVVLPVPAPKEVQL
jgi:Protein of unknown function (DUF3450)